MPHIRGIVTTQRLLACGEGPRMSAGRGAGSGEWTAGPGRELLRSVRSEGAHSAFPEVGRAGAGRGDGLISWESDAGSHAGFAQVDGPVGRLGWRGLWWTWWVLPLTCSALVEAHQHRGSSGCPGHAELDRGVRFPHTRCVVSIVFFTSLLHIRTVRNMTGVCT